MIVKRNRCSVPAVILILVLVVAARPLLLSAEELTPVEQLGKSLFFDASLSSPEGQSCATCHAPAVGFTGPDEAVNKEGGVYRGAVNERFGNRKPPAASYCGDSPLLHTEKDDGESFWVGGMFWDGRATGKKLNDPLAEQAQGPFLNPLEHNLKNAEEVCGKVKSSSYARLFEEVWGKGSLDCAKNIAGTYDRIAKAISAYEKSKEVNPFTSKYDAWLAGKASLTEKEQAGIGLFVGKGKCANCHVIAKRAGGGHPLFTDFTYDNLGIPGNPANPFYTMPKEWNPQGKNWTDNGLGGFLKDAGYKRGQYEPEMGKFKVPTLRNVDKRPNPGFVKAYGHNGYFKSLKEIVHFYNTRDVLPRCEKAPDPKPGVNCWPRPEVAKNLNREEMGNLGLSPEEEDAIVVFMQSLSDGYAPR
ncbi:MAG: cytochrome-c peroxidase [bacterium]